MVQVTTVTAVVIVETAVIAAPVINTHAVVAKVVATSAARGPMVVVARVPMIASQHHERMDGKGYPKGLAAADIHQGARIVAAADVFDALTAPRYYKPAYPVDKTLEIMDGMAGAHLDPKVMEAVHRALPQLERKIEELRGTWPKAGDQGMGSVSEAAGALSERDGPQPAAKP